MNHLFQNFLCLLFGHNWKARVAIVIYPAVVGGIDALDIGRECFHCHRKEILDHETKKFVEQSKFDEKYKTTTRVTKEGEELS